MTSFASDGPAVMVGKKNGVIAHLKGTANVVHFVLKTVFVNLVLCNKYTKYACLKTIIK